MGSETKQLPGNALSEEALNSIRGYQGLAAEARSNRPDTSLRNETPWQSNLREGMMSGLASYHPDFTGVEQTGMQSVNNILGQSIDPMKNPMLQGVFGGIQRRGNDQFQSMADQLRANAQASGMGSSSALNSALANALSQTALGMQEQMYQQAIPWQQNMMNTQLSASPLALQYGNTQRGFLPQQMQYQQQAYGLGGVPQQIELQKQQDIQNWYQQQLGNMGNASQFYTGQIGAMGQPNYLREQGAWGEYGVPIMNSVATVVAALLGSKKNGPS